MSRKNIFTFVLSALVSFGASYLPEPLGIVNNSVPIASELYYILVVFVSGIIAGYFNPIDFLAAPAGLLVGFTAFFFIYYVEIIDPAGAVLSSIIFLPIAFVGVFTTCLVGRSVGKLLRSWLL